MPPQAKNPASNLLQKLSESVKDLGELKDIVNKIETNQIEKTIGIAKDHLLINRGQQIFYIDIDTLKETDKLADRVYRNLNKYFSIQDGFKLLKILDIGGGETALLLCSDKNRLSFY